MEDVGLVINLDCVACIRPTLKTHDDFGIRAEEVDDLCFALVAPLSTENDRCGHTIPFLVGLDAR